jgi:5'-nucleotidase
VPLILLTNDDGIEAEGLKWLEDSLQELGEIIVVAPDRERSAVSHGLTIHSPLLPTEVRQNHYVLNGTPADCVIYSLSKLLTRYPDVVISGINHGANLGEDIMYSGTVAAAREASRYGIPSLAISQAYDQKPITFKGGARFVRFLIQSLLDKGPSGAMCLNVNLPVRRIRGIKITRQGCSSHFQHFNSLDAHRNGEPSQEAIACDRYSGITFDYEAVHDQYVSITPLQRDQTDYPAVQSLIQEAPKLFQGMRFSRLGLIGFKN